MDGWTDRGTESNQYTPPPTTLCWGYNNMFMRHLILTIHFLIVARGSLYWNDALVAYFLSVWVVCCQLRCFPPHLIALLRIPDPRMAIAGDTLPLRRADSWSAPTMAAHGCTPPRPQGMRRRNTCRWRPVRWLSCPVHSLYCCCLLRHQVLWRDRINSLAPGRF